MTHQIKNRGARGYSSRNLAGKPALNEKPPPQLQSSRWWEQVTFPFISNIVLFLPHFSFFYICLYTAHRDAHMLPVVISRTFPPRQTDPPPVCRCKKTAYLISISSLPSIMSFMSRIDKSSCSFFFSFIDLSGSFKTPFRKSPFVTAYPFFASETIKRCSLL